MNPRWLLSALCVSLAAWSCGQTDSDEPPAEPTPPSPDAGGSGGAMTADMSCGDACPALPQPTDPRFRYAEACCTADGLCGSGSERVFGTACFERDQPGQPHEECTGVVLFLYVDLGSNIGVADWFDGCCRSDGLCGVDTSRSVGAGCVELSALGAALDEGAIEQNQGLGLMTQPCAP